MSNLGNKKRKHQDLDEKNPTQDTSIVSSILHISSPILGPENTGVCSHELVYDQNNDVLIIRNFLSDQEQAMLHGLITNSTHIALHYGKSEDSYELDVAKVPVDQKIQQIVMDKKKLFVDALRSKSTKIFRAVIKRLTFSYDAVLCVRYENEKKRWKHHPRTQSDDVHLMDMHRDSWSTDNMTISLGHPAKFTYIDKTNNSEHQVIVNSGDLMSFDGDSMDHKVDSFAKDAPEWFKYDEYSDIYRYNIQFTKHKPRHSKRLKKMDPDEEEKPEHKSNISNPSDSSDDENEDDRRIRQQSKILSETIANCQTLMLLNAHSESKVNGRSPRTTSHITHRFTEKLKNLGSDIEGFMKDISRDLKEDKLHKVIDDEMEIMDKMDSDDYIHLQRLEQLKRYLKSVKTSH